GLAHDSAATAISTLSLHDALPICQVSRADVAVGWFEGDREVIEHRPAGFVPPLTTPPRRWVRPPIKDRQKADFLEFFEEGRQLVRSAEPCEVSDELAIERGALVPAGGHRGEICECFGSFAGRSGYPAVLDPPRR